MFKWLSSQDSRKEVRPRVGTTARLSKDGECIIVSPVLDAEDNHFRRLNKNGVWEPSSMILLDQETYEDYSKGRNIIWRYRVQELVEELNTALKDSKVGDEIQLIISGAVIARLNEDREGYIEMIEHLDNVLDEYAGEDSFLPNN